MHPKTHHLPGDGVTHRMHAPARIEGRRFAVREDDAGRAERREDDARRDDTVAHRARRVIARATDDRRAFIQSQRAAPSGVSVPVTSCDSYNFPSTDLSICSSESSLSLQARFATSSSSMPEASETSVAYSPVIR